MSSSKSETVPPPADVRKMGYLRKLKTMKKKFFVLKADSENKPARLEYYDNEKKWKLGAQPKRCIILKTCFNINRKLDTKHKHALALYTKDDCFTIILDNDDELDSWLRALLELQQGDTEMESNEPLKPSFEHIWQVNIRNRGLASTKNILGSYHLCLTSQVLSLVKLNTEVPEIIKFPLMSIRRCGHSYCFFFMEVGRSAVTGAGELWMQTEDVIIAQNMHEAILNAMRSGTKDEITPRLRTRSSSTNESSKPITVHMRRQTTIYGPIVAAASRERSDSVPSRPQTLSDSGNEFGNSPGSIQYIMDSCGSSGDCVEHDSLQLDFFPTHSTEASSDHDLSIFDEYLPMTPPDINKGSLKSNEHADDGYMAMASPSSLPPTGLLLRSRTPSTTNSPNIGLLTANSTGKVISLPLQADYFEMASPTSNSPAESDGYMQMSPLGSSLPNVASKVTCPVRAQKTASTRSNSGSCHNRKTSLDDTRKTSLDETNRGSYIPMSPVGGNLKCHMDSGYLEMSSMKKTKDDFDVGSPAVSDASSADLRFSEFQLEKVTAYFSPNEEEEKLVRAYSVGSKIAASQNKNAEDHLDSNRADSSRVRAFSVGSKVGLRFGKKKVDQTDQSLRTESNDKKSQSAPVLGVSNHSWSGTSLLQVGGNKSKQSEDLMELDFARSQKPSLLLKTVTMGKRKDDVSSLKADRITTSIRPRSNSRSSSTCPSKGETLQVIGEKSDLNVSCDLAQNVETNQLHKLTPKVMLQNVDLNVKNSASLGSTWTATKSHNSTHSSPGESFSHLNFPVTDTSLSISEYINVDMNRQTHRKYSGVRSTVSMPAKCLPKQVDLHSKFSSISSQVMDKQENLDEPQLNITKLRIVSDSHSNSRDITQTSEKVEMDKQCLLVAMSNSMTTSPLPASPVEFSLQTSNSACTVSFPGDEKMESTTTEKPLINDIEHNQLEKLHEAETPYENIVCCTREQNSSQPGSLGNECELNYASLDLASTVVCDDTISLLLHDMNSGNSNQANEDETLSYASIDFRKSEGLRHTSVMRESKHD